MEDFLFFYLKKYCRCVSPFLKSVFHFFTRFFFFLVCFVFVPDFESRP